MTSLDIDETSEDGQPPTASNPDVKDDSVGHLREQAVSRKQRLLQLRMRQASKQNGEQSPSENEDLPKPVFRNYKPQSDELKSGELPVASSIDLIPYVSSQLDAANAPVVVEEVNLVSLAPRKPDWDLKRGVEKKLQKLERRTQRAIAELIRERLRNTESDLATTVNQQPAPIG
ncbi:hypothetical protein EG68_04349 [Paragonimus skrjabini miyazakii]|uniref:Coiled-coil domain-containing protein 12 n=1 Tax=Paragonimus skrjabini miyazakii TaxID=59628 RepID=A0A8S9YZ70_9TREM|nr:hypothetical protein EG68_04349 [Paragonimus skrjabini miyazakii]